MIVSSAIATQCSAAIACGEALREKSRTRCTRGENQSRPRKLPLLVCQAIAATNFRSLRIVLRFDRATDQIGVRASFCGAEWMTAIRHPAHTTCAHRNTTRRKCRGARSAPRAHAEVFDRTFQCKSVHGSRRSVGAQVDRDRRQEWLSTFDSPCARIRGADRAMVGNS